MLIWAQHNLKKCLAGVTSSAGACGVAWASGACLVTSATGPGVLTSKEEGLGGLQVYAVEGTCLLGQHHLSTARGPMQQELSGYGPACRCRCAAALGNQVPSAAWGFGA